MKEQYVNFRSIKGVKGFVRQDITTKDDVYWFIRFNIPLDTNTVNDSNMDVTDKDGYILTSDITYSNTKNAIIISPQEPYNEEKTYILNISTNVCSENGNRLKEKVQVVFEIKGGEISNFVILKGKETIKLDKKPSKYMENINAAKNIRVPIARIKVNFIIAIVAFILFMVNLTISFLFGIIGSLLLLVFGIAHIFLQLLSTKSKSIRLYNKGVIHFNKGEYGDAAEYFNYALAMDINNRYAKEAIRVQGLKQSKIKSNGI